jgi:hypothetical protein
VFAGKSGSASSLGFNPRRHLSTVLTQAGHQKWSANQRKFTSITVPSFHQIETCSGDHMKNGSPYFRLGVDRMVELMSQFHQPIPGANDGEKSELRNG